MIIKQSNTILIIQIILYILISIIILILINKTIYCDQGNGDYVMKSISWYDLHNIDMRDCGKNWESYIIKPYLGKLTFLSYDISDTKVTKIYQGWGIKLCDLQVLLDTHSEHGKIITISKNLTDLWPSSEDGLIQLPLKQEFLNNNTLVIDYKAGDLIKPRSCNCNLT